MSQIKLYKLATGEEIVGRFVEEEDEFVVLSKIRVMIMQPVGNVQVQIGMVPWTVGSPDGNIKVYRTTIVGEPISTLPKQLEDGYLANTSGLDLTSSTKDLGISK